MNSLQYLVKLTNKHLHVRPYRLRTIQNILACCLGASNIVYVTFFTGSGHLVWIYVISEILEPEFTVY